MSRGCVAGPLVFPRVVWKGSSYRIVLTSHHDANVEERDGADALGVERWKPVISYNSIRSARSRFDMGDEGLGIEFLTREMVVALVAQVEETERVKVCLALAVVEREELRPLTDVERKALDLGGVPLPRNAR